MDQFYHDLADACTVWGKCYKAAAEHPGLASVHLSKRSMEKRVRHLALKLLEAHRAEELSTAMEE